MGSRRLDGSLGYETDHWAMNYYITLRCGKNGDAVGGNNMVIVMPAP